MSAPIRLMVVSTDKLTDQIVDSLKKESSEAFEVVFHMGRKNSDFRASSIRRMHPDRKSPRYMFDRDYFNNFALKWSENPEFANSLYNFIDHLYRSNSDLAIKANPIQYIHEAYDYFHIAFDYISSLIRELEINHILFFNIPHLAYDTIVYEVANSQKIKTTILNQSLFPNKFFSTPSIKSFGTSLGCGDQTALYPINKDARNNLFYMKGITNLPQTANRLSSKAILSLLVYIVSKERSLLINPRKLLGLIRRIKNIYKSYPQWRDPFAKFFNRSSLEYFEYLHGIYNQAPDLSCDFVYFPLQMQPEMTTSAIGDIFIDQALAIENLSLILPEDVKIYIKENPKQTGHMRGSAFFYRLKKIKNLEFIPEHFDTHTLTEKSVFVATITGTVGWEAICKGKPALVFGSPWYLSLPGIFKYNKTTTYSSIKEFSIEHKILEREVGKLLTKTHEGVIDRHYSILVPNFDPQNNAKKIATTILDLITLKTPYTFSEKT